MRVTWPVHVFLLDFVTRIIGEEYKLLTSLCKFLQSPIYFLSLLGPHILHIQFSIKCIKRNYENSVTQLAQYWLDGRSSVHGDEDSCRGLLCVMTPWSDMIGYHRFRGPCSLHRQGFSSLLRSREQLWDPSRCLSIRDLRLFHWV